MTVLLIIVFYSGYPIIDQAVTITYMEQGYEYAGNALNELLEIINKTDLTKTQVEGVGP